MSFLQLHQARYRLSDTRTFWLDELTVRQKESWAFVGANGSGKSVLAKAISGELPLLEGQRQCSFQRIARLSFEQLQQLVSQEWQRNNTDMLSEGEHDAGRTTAAVIQDAVMDEARCSALAEQFGIAHLLQRRFKHLSTGEARKSMLCQALMPQPDLLILDEPFDGLDLASRRQLSNLLGQLTTQGYTLVLIINRFEDIPAFVEYVGVLADCSLTRHGKRKQMMADELVALLAHSEKHHDVRLPEPESPRPQGTSATSTQPLIRLNHGVVSYDDRRILDDLSWTVMPGQHWQIIGPNGAGKSTLLSLITGDHPQGYSNDLTLFGRRRGSGETIWDIKRHIGYVSSSLHMDYRVSISVRHVILSGFFDSIGVYRTPSDRQNQLTAQWLSLLGLPDATADAPFQSLSWGQQRLVLIVRALVKHPALLILDEPLQGLDPINRQLIRSWLDRLIGEGDTQLLFVSHHAEDAPHCITHRLRFVPEGPSYRYLQETC
ncbi:molybdate ABC transporter ATP-binding protein ModF [Lonsdalea populi]|uniref:Molybdate ABC transporter ATP-binding protein ModF n=4 Tax=Lonsdalea populi TaxID=1172565 RepID=A0A3N0ULX8_9GAMM|nr:molybdate ABC transporter ATP-binding protein ModF [Lonsdalea populi]ROH79013.1 molybdate ABC transporter ATP-binding protein ModF [Lonsdalea populi]ROH81278.1 molybdate ABC transporter ATP-binding protein ModF [Lonsdalea populi]